MKTIEEVVLKCVGNKIIRYFLLTNTDEYSKVMYGICISEQIKDNVLAKEKIENISDDKNFVSDIINHLSENIIDTVHFKDIVDDYMSKDNTD